MFHQATPRSILAQTYWHCCPPVTVLSVEVTLTNRGPVNCPRPHRQKVVGWIWTEAFWLQNPSPSPPTAPHGSVCFQTYVTKLEGLRLARTLSLLCAHEGTLRPPRNARLARGSCSPAALALATGGPAGAPDSPFPPARPHQHISLESLLWSFSLSPLSWSHSISFSFAFRHTAVEMRL